MLLVHYCEIITSPSRCIADSLDGGKGSDLISGGIGNDIYRYSAGGGNDTFDEEGAGSAGDRISMAAGMTIANISRFVTDGIDRLRYLGSDAVVETFDALVALYSGAGSDAERDRIVKSAIDLSKHDLTVWQAAGPAVQDLLIKKVSELDADTLAAVKPH